MPQSLYRWLKSLCCLLLFATGQAAYAADAAVRAHILAVSDTVKSGKYVRQRFSTQLEQPFNPDDARKKLLIIGDSHAQDLTNALWENGVQQRYQFSTRRIPAICGLYLGTENIKALIDQKHRAICAEADTLHNALPQIRQADVVIIAANWKLWSVQRLQTTVQNLAMQAPQQLFVVGRKNFGKLRLRQYLRLSATELRQLRNPVRGAQQAINQIMQQTLARDVFVDIQGLLCQSADDCPLFTPELRLISFDGGHLTQDGARYVGGVLLRHSPLDRL